MTRESDASMATRTMRVVSENTVHPLVYL